MSIRRYFCLFLLLLPVVGTAADAVYQEDFEGQSVVRWRGGEVVADTVQGKALSITAAARERGRWLAHPIPVQPGTSYRFSYKVRGIKLDGRLQWGVRCGERAVIFECTSFAGDTDWESGQVHFATLDGEDRLGLLCIVGGPGSALVDDLQIVEAPEAFAPPTEFASRALVHDGPDAAVYQVSPAARVYAESRPADAPQAQAVVVTAVRGEYASFQLVLRGKQAAEVSASLNGLDGPGAIAPDEVAVFAVRDIDLPLAALSSPYAVAGPNPDPLEAAGTLSLTPGQNSAFFIRVHISEDLPAGQYTGTIHLDGIGVDIPLHINVADLALGRERWLPTMAHVRLPRNLAGEELEALQSVLSAEVYSHGCYQDWALARALSDVEWVRQEDNDVVIDFAAFDEAMASALSQGAGKISIPPIGLRKRLRQEEGPRTRLTKWLGLEPLSPQFNTVFPKYCEKMAAHLREKGWLDRAFMYLWDEPNIKEIDTYKQLLEIAKAGAPDLKQAVAGGATPCPELYGLVDIWTVNLRQNVMKPSLLSIVRERQALGEEVGAYGNNRYALDNPTAYMRLWGWTLAMYDLEHTGWWSVLLYGRGDPLQIPASPKKAGGRPGSGSLIYPDPDDITQIWPSLRWEAMRDGAEDFGLIRMLADTLKQQADTLGIGESYDSDVVLGAILAPVVWGNTELQFNPDAELIEELREAIIGEIAGAKVGPPGIIYLQRQQAHTVAKVYMEPNAKLTVNGTLVEVRNNTIPLPERTEPVRFTISGPGGQREIVRFVSADD